MLRLLSFFTYHLHFYAFHIGNRQSPFRCLLPQCWHSKSSSTTTSRIPVLPLSNYFQPAPRSGAFEKNSMTPCSSCLAIFKAFSRFVFPMPSTTSSANSSSAWGFERSSCAIDIDSSIACPRSQSSAPRRKIALLRPLNPCHCTKLHMRAL